MKIADVTVGTEYAYNPYGYNDTDWERLNSHSRQRVLVTNTHPGGKVTLQVWDAATRTFKDYSSRPVSARGLIMPWAEAVPILKEIRERNAAAAKARAARMEREQDALRALGQFLEGQAALDLPGLPYSLRGAIDLANGHERSQRGSYDLPNRHEPNVPLNAITLLTLLRKAYTQGYEDAANQKPTAAFTYTGE